MKRIVIVVAGGPTRWGEVARRSVKGEIDMRLLIEVEDGEGALVATRAHRPTIVLVDEDILRGEGLDLIRRIRRASRRASVLAVTRREDDAFAIRVVSHGGHGAMAEDTLLDELPRAVRAVATGQTWLTRRQEGHALETLWRLAPAGGRPQRSATSRAGRGLARA